MPAPVEQGLVSSLARPGGNLTGLSTQSDKLTGKRLELLKGAFPRMARVAVPSSGLAAQTEMLNTAAKALGLQLLYARAERADELAAAPAAWGRHGWASAHRPVCSHGCDDAMLAQPLQQYEAKASIR